jgi:tetratricopeptide (TPR) repeat protein
MTAGGKAKLVPAPGALLATFALACLLLLLLVTKSAAAAKCTVSDYAPKGADRDAVILEAGSLSSSDRWADARAAYLWVLARHRDDPEALFGLARLDSWGGCYRLAEQEYLAILTHHPEDADVRAGYVDLLLWDGRNDEAQRVLDRGLARDAGAPALLQRAGRMAYWSGDATRAVRLADAAEQAAPDDGDVRAERDRLFLHEVRAGARIDHYPSGWQDLVTLNTQGLDRIGRFDLSAGAEIVARAGAGAPTIVDAHYPVSLAYHPSQGVTFGAEVEPGAPARAIANLALKVWAQAPLTHLVDAQLAYQFWHFSLGPEIVHIFNPALGIALPYEVRLELRAWLSVADLSGHDAFPAQVSVAGAGGFLVSWHAANRLDLGVTYTYGNELDQNPTVVQLLSSHGHAVAAYGDWLLGRHGGIRVTLGLDRRELSGGPVLWIPSAEVGGYVRW